MSTSNAQPEGMDHEGAEAATAEPAGPAGYEAPRILWREPYQPLSFGISCAKVQGNPSCIAPVSS